MQESLIESGNVRSIGKFQALQGVIMRAKIIVERISIKIYPKLKIIIK
jgi:hypothetical protein